MKFKLKVCGLKFTENIEAVAKMHPDFMGFIFYPKSPRCMGNELSLEFMAHLPKEIKKTGVFVNEKPSEMVRLAEEYSLDYLQLHGEESPELCMTLKNMEYKIIKAFSISGDFDFSVVNAYKPFVEYFLFDTKGMNPGGNGETFNWKILDSYDNEKPFFLSGGISLDNFELLKELRHLNIYAIDVNSKFEIEPGVKDLEKLKILVSNLNLINDRLQ